MLNSADLNLNLLVTFSVLLETLSFSECARRLKCSQPTVSRQVSELERALGQQLFLRDRHRVEPTEAGRRLRQSVVPHLSEILRNVTEADNAKPGFSGNLRFGSLREVGQSTFMAMLLGFRKLHPNVRLEISYAEQSQIRDQLRSGHLDFGLLTEADKLENIRCYRLLQEHIVVLTRATNSTNPFNDRKRAVSFVTYNASDTLFEQFKKALTRRSAARNLQAEVCVNSHRSMMDALLASDCFAVMPLLSARAELAAGHLRLVPGYEITKSVYLAHFDNPHASLRDREFKKFLIAECRASYKGIRPHAG